MLKEVVIQAYNFAKEKHGNQKRRFSNLPAFSHPKAAARIVEQLTNDPEMIAAALLHDTVEDTNTTIQEIRDKFGERIAGLVDEVTSKAEERGFKKKKDYLHGSKENIIMGRMVPLGTGHVQHRGVRLQPDEYIRKMPKGRRKREAYMEFAALFKK